MSVSAQQSFGRIAVALAALSAFAVMHLALGSKWVPPSDVLSAFYDFDRANFDHIVVREMRLPRMLAAMAIGASLSVAGAIMQGVTRNPLADPGLLGLMSGASFGVVIGAGWFGLGSDAWLPFWAAIGSLGAAIVVLAICAMIPQGRSPAVLLLTGAAVSVFLNSIVAGVNLLNEESFSIFRVWLSGAITNSAATKLGWVWPWMVAGLGVALVLARQVTTLSMGHEAATGLGVDVKRLSIALLLCVVVLTASAVALAGPIAFVGLVVPHATRLFVGSDYRRVIPFAAVFGAGFMIVVDLVARSVFAPAEIATGIVTSFCGAPLFLYLVRKRL